MTDYQPIDCGFHSEFELAIMHNETLKISWHEPNTEKQIQRVKPVDLITRNHEEFLVIEDERDVRNEIRLDYIAEISK